METGSYCMKWIRVGKHGRLCHHSKVPQMTGSNNQHLLDLWRTAHLCLKRYYQDQWLIMLARITLMTFNTVCKEANMTSLVKYVLGVPLQFRLHSQ
jgi:hypothetical protein